MNGLEEILFNESIKIVKFMYNNEFEKLNELGYCREMSMDILKNELYEYGGSIDEVDEEKYKKSFSYIKYENEDSYVTYLNLFIDQEESDLTLMTNVSFYEDKIDVFIDDLHVKWTLCQVH